MLGGRQPGRAHAGHDHRAVRRDVDEGAEGLGLVRVGATPHLATARAGVGRAEGEAEAGRGLGGAAQVVVLVGVGHGVGTGEDHAELGLGAQVARTLGRRRRLHLPDQLGDLRLGAGPLGEAGDGGREGDAGLLDLLGALVGPVGPQAEAAGEHRQQRRDGHQGHGDERLLGPREPGRLLRHERLGERLGLVGHRPAGEGRVGWGQDVLGTRDEVVGRRRGRRRVVEAGRLVLERGPLGHDLCSRPAGRGP